MAGATRMLLPTQATQPEAPPGTLMRRRFLALAALALQLPDALHASNPESAVEALLSGASDLQALAQSTRALDQEQYVHSLAVRALLVPHFREPTYVAMKRAQGVEVGTAEKGSGIACVHYRLAADAVVPPHDHPNYSVVTLLLEGEALVEQFEPANASPAHDDPTPFAVRKTSERLLRPGSFATLAPTRENLHRFRAGARGARWVDLSTRHGEKASFSFLEFVQPPERAGSTGMARWAR